MPLESEHFRSLLLLTRVTLSWRERDDRVDSARKFWRNFALPSARGHRLLYCHEQYGTRVVFVVTAASGSMRSRVLCSIPPVGRSCAYASSISRNHVLWKLTVFSREHQLRDYGRRGAKGWEGGGAAENGYTACLYRACLYVCMVRACVRKYVYPVIEINRARNLRHTVLRRVVDTESQATNFSVGRPCDLNFEKKKRKREIKKNSSIIPVAKCSIDSRKNYLSHKSLHAERYVLHVSKCYLLQLFHKIIYLLTSSYVYLQIYSKFIISIKFIEHIFWVSISLHTSIKNIK